MLEISNENKNILLPLEQVSEHPLASAIQDYLKNENIKEFNIENFESITGQGVFANFNKNSYWTGNL